VLRLPEGEKVPRIIITNNAVILIIYYSYGTTTRKIRTSIVPYVTLRQINLIDAAAATSRRLLHSEHSIDALQ
jgi:hypothetical protein